MPQGKPLPVAWLPVARVGRQQQLSYIGERNPAAAHRLSQEILRAVERISIFPQSARPGSIAGTRELAIPRTPFTIIYSVEPDAILILRLLHQAQQWPPD